MIKSRIKTTVKSSKINAKKFIDESKRHIGAYVSIGVHEGAGAYPDGTLIAEVALFNEFGTETAPERSFIRSTLEEHKADLNRWRQEFLQKMLLEGWTTEKALNAMGFRIAELVRNKIKSNVPPPNAPSTLRAKQRHGVAPNTLIDTGLLLRSVTYQVHL